MTHEYEYLSDAIRTLDNTENKFILIPNSVMMNQDLSIYRVTLYSFFMIHKGLTDEVTTCLNEIVAWMGKVPTRSVNGISNKVYEAIQAFEKAGYITLLTELKNTKLSKIRVNCQLIEREIDNDYYSRLYLDEIKAVIDCDDISNSVEYYNVETIMLVLANIRKQIPFRQNKLNIEEINIDNKKSYQYDIEYRRKNRPEACSFFIGNFIDDLGISHWAAVNSIIVLSELNILYYKRDYRFMINGKWNTSPVYLCNRHKRNNGYYYEGGNEYCEREIANKINKDRKSRGIVK